MHASEECIAVLAVSISASKPLGKTIRLQLRYCKCMLHFKFPSHLSLHMTWKSRLSKTVATRSDRRGRQAFRFRSIHVVRIRIIISAVPVSASATSDDTLTTSLNAFSSGALHQFRLPAWKTDKGCRLLQSDGGGIQPRRLSSKRTTVLQRNSTALHALNSSLYNSSSPPHPPPSPGPTHPYYSSPSDKSPPPTRHSRL